MKLSGDRWAVLKAKAAFLTTLAIAVLALAQKSVAMQTSASSTALKNADLASVTLRRVIVSLPDRKLALLRNGQVVKTYPVAVGKPSTPSPVGEFKIVNRVTNPTYYHRGQVITPGNDNPVGSRWIGLSAKGYGIHGTNQPASIGKAASTGCIRMSKHDLEELFAELQVGDAVEIHAERDEQLSAIFGSTSDALPQATAEEPVGGGQ